jgi:uncharacterized protein
MSQRDRYEPGVPCWVDTLQPDPRAAVAFYAELFGWEFEGPGPTPDGGEYYVARLHGHDIAGVGTAPAEGAPPAPAWITHVSAVDVDRTVEKAVAAGGTVVAGPFDAAPAGRIAVVSDPGGATFCVWQPAERHGAQRVNEAGAWSMSALGTPDPAGAATFYEAVFGWQADAMQFGDAAITLFRLPGYVGGEPGQPVPRDVVAVMQQSNGGAPAAWNVDFWVSSTDDVTRRATERGGAVIVAPHETAGFRNAVLADPHGAAFSVSQLLAAH